MNIVLSCLRQIHYRRSDTTEYYGFWPFVYMYDRDFSNTEKLENAKLYLETTVPLRTAKPLTVIKMDKLKILEFGVLYDSVTKRITPDASFKDSEMSVFTNICKQGVSIKPNYNLLKSVSV
jgi:hypothetical protein